MHFKVWYIKVRKNKPEINFFDNILLSYDSPEFSQNFGISVPMNMNNEKKKKFYFFFSIFFFYFLNKECYLWVLDFWYLRN